MGAFLYRAPQSLVYQWTRDGAEIAGATAPTHTPTAAGTYRCGQSATNQAGSTLQTSEGSVAVTSEGSVVPPPPSPPGPPATDTSAPDGDVKAKGSQKAGGAIKIKVGSNEAATASATGKVIAKGGSKARSLTALAAKKKGAKFKLKPASKEIAAGGTVTLKLKQKGGKKKKRTLVKLVKGGAKAKAKIKWTLTDLAGNSTSGKLVVKLKK